MLPVVMAAVSVAGSLLGDHLDRQAAKEAQKQALQAYKALLISTQETTKRADQYGDDVYTRAMGDLNTGAFAYAGALNPETMRTLAFSKMGVARSQIETAVKEEDYKFNKGVQTQMAQIGAQPLPTTDVTGALGAGVGGYFAGRQLEMNQELADLNKQYISNLLPEDKITGINKATTNLVKTAPGYELSKPSYFGKDFTNMVKPVPMPPNPSITQMERTNWNETSKALGFNYDYDEMIKDNQNALPDYGFETELQSNNKNIFGMPLIGLTVDRKTGFPKERIDESSYSTWQDAAEYFLRYPSRYKGRNTKGLIWR